MGGTKLNVCSGGKVEHTLNVDATRNFHRIAILIIDYGTDSTWNVCLASHILACLVTVGLDVPVLVGSFTSGKSRSLVYFDLCNVEGLIIRALDDT